MPYKDDEPIPFNEIMIDAVMGVAPIDWFSWDELDALTTDELIAIYEGIKRAG